MPQQIFTARVRLACMRRLIVAFAVFVKALAAAAMLGTTPPAAIALH
jgi:hypothetical protein